MSRRAWGRLPPPSAVAPFASKEQNLIDRHAELPKTEGSLLAYGNGRSYGDVCLNHQGTLLLTRPLQRFIAFDRAHGVLRCEAGVLLADVLALCVPQGWFLPVTPGTRFVTLGGALANDVHGKNHPSAGTFGRHVRCFELLRSDGSRRVCSPTTHSEWFAASIGGLGLTGLITWLEIQLKPIDSPCLRLSNTRFQGLDEFFALNEAQTQNASTTAEHTVAWIDCLATTPRGIFMTAEHVANTVATAAKLRSPKTTSSLALPELPFAPINRYSLKLLNAAYYHRPLPAQAVVHYLPFFYPLDRLREWNRLYGRAGFYQYQCVLPWPARAALAELLQQIARSAQGSFLAVLKAFGALPSPGLLSFPMPGVTLALDFPNRGAPSLALFERLDAIVSAAGGRVYAAKDARMSGAFFRRSYPEFERFSAYVDPKFSSDFWRRIGA
ncbi:MAG: FAD-binding oxidoreductase [Pseudomonadota bacterium]